MSKTAEIQRLRHQVKRLRDTNAAWQKVVRDLADINEIQRLELLTVYGGDRMVSFKRVGDHELPVPARATEHSAAFDLRALYSVQLYPGECKLVPTGWAVDVGAGMCGLVLPRSGRGHKEGLVLGNGSGLIDRDYCDEVMVSLWNRNLEGAPITVEAGERVAQLSVHLIQTGAQEVTELPNESLNRGGGFGSTGEQ